MSSDSSLDLGEEPLFTARLDSVATIATLLKAVAFCEKVNVFISDNGLKFMVEEGKYVQAYVLMQKELFLDYTIQEEETYFKIPLKELLECLKIFCSDGKSIDTTMAHLPNTSLSMSYRKSGSPLEIILEENGIQTEFRLKTEEIDNLMDFDIDPVDCKIALKSDLFFELLQEVDNYGPEYIEIRVEPVDKVMIISGKATSGMMEVMIPESSAVVDYFECGTESLKAYFRLSILKYAFKAIQIGEKLVLKLNSDGVLSLSFLLTTKADSFVEFFCIPLQTDEDEFENEG